MLVSVYVFVAETVGIDVLDNVWVGMLVDATVSMGVSVILKSPVG